MLADQRVYRAALRCHRGITRLPPRHDGVDRVAAQARQDKAAVGADLHQRVVARIGGTAASGNKPGAEQFAATGQVQRGLWQHRHRLTAKDHPHIEVAIEVRNRPLAKERHGLTVVLVDLAIHRATVGQHQALAAHRSQATGQQLDFLGAQDADFDQPQGGAHDPALLDGRAAQLQATEGRVRYSACLVAGTGNGQGARRVVAGNPVHVASQHPCPDFGRRVQLRGPQGHVAPGHELGTDAQSDCIRAGPGEETQVTLAAQLHIIETTPFDTHLAIVGLSQAALVAEQHIAAYLQQIGVGVEHRLGGALRHGAGQHRMQVLVLGFQGRKDARQQQVRCRQVDPGIWRSILTQAEGAAVQAQALAHLQR
ncbi:hypothetical protein [Pseudomonas sp. 25 R 14]|nr:hypothetical protein [Pseudomonas sp. 25 R 14]